jgi:hypothetical protein
VVTIDAKGRVTALTSAAISGTSPGGSAGGHLTGNFPNPSIQSSVLGGAAWTLVTAASDQSIANSSTQQNDAELFIALANGGVYEIDLVIIYACPTGGAVSDMKVSVGEDATARGGFLGNGISGSDGTLASPILADQSSNIGFGTATGNRVFILRGTYLSAGGTFRFLWAQNTAGGNSNATIRRAGSFMRYRQVA